MVYCLVRFMAKDYFQDIMPPAGDSGMRRVPRAVPVIPHEEEVTSEDTVEAEEIPQAPRGIRSISAPARSRPHVRADAREM